MQNATSLLFRLFFIFVLTLPLYSAPRVAPAAPQEEGSYDEDFSSYAYKGQAEEAVWDIWNQQLRLRRADGGAFISTVADTVAASDASGNTFIAWLSMRGNRNNIFAQKVDPQGNRLWAEDVQVSVEGGDLPSIAVDEQGNAVVVWRAGRIEAQKLSPDGELLWPRTYVSDADKAGQAPRIKLAASGQFWVTYLSNSDYDPDKGWLSNFYCQKLEASGGRVFAQSKRINSADVYNGSVFVYAEITAMEDGGAIVAWGKPADYAPTSTYAQALDSDCNPQWTQDLQIAQTGYDPKVVLLSDGYAGILWTSDGAHMQGVNQSGQIKWTQAITLSDNYNFPIHAALAVDGGQAIVTSSMASGGYYGNLRVQKYNLSGAALWAQPVQLCNSEGCPFTADLALRPDGSILAAWGDTRSGAKQVLVDRIRPDGSLITPKEIVVNQDSGQASQTFPVQRVAPDGTVYAAWLDNRRGSTNLYLNSFDPAGQPRWQNDLLVNPAQPGYTAAAPILLFDLNQNVMVVWEAQGALWLQKFDPNGNRLWVEPAQMLSSGFDTFANWGVNIVYAAADGASGLYIGYSSMAHVYIQRFDETGSPLWQEAVRLDPDGSSSWVATLATNAAHNLAVTWGDPVAHLVYLQRLNLDGEKLWPAPLQINTTTMAWPPYGEAVAVDPSGNMIVIWNDPYPNSYLMGQKITPSGERLWNAGQDLIVGGTGGLRPYMTIAHDGLPLVVFNIDSPHIRKLDANGGTLWDRAYSSSSYYNGHNESISVDGSGNIVAGLQELQDTNWDAHLYKFGSDGSPSWSTPVVISDSFYMLEGYAQSLSIDAVAGNISQANLTADFELNAGSVVFYLSNNGGTSWEAVEPGVTHRFGTHASDLRWKAELAADPYWPRAPVVNSIHIEYTAADPGQDDYEPDDTCDQAQPIDALGAPQFHTFDKISDEDWVWFQAAISQTYSIQTSETQENIATAIRVYDDCSGLTLAEALDAPGGDVKLELTATADGPLYLRLTNRASEDAITLNGYQVAVREIERTPVGMIVVGQAETPEQQAALDASGDLAYVALLEAGAVKANLRYYSPSPDHDADGNGSNDDISGVAELEALRDSVQDWPREQGLQMGLPFYAVLIGPGDSDQFLAAPGVTLTATDLDLWLDNLQATSGADNLNVIIDASKSGSFIVQSGEEPDALVGPNRVIIASTSVSETAFLAPEGSLFSDLFFEALMQEKDLRSAFELAAQAVFDLGASQTPQIDGGLNGSVGGEAQAATQAGGLQENFLAQMRGLDTTRSLAPVVDQLSIERTPDGGAVVQVRARDDVLVTRVRVLLAPYRTAGAGGSPILDFQMVEALPIPGSPDTYQATLDSIEGWGVVAFAWDGEENRSAPAAVSLMEYVYLPVVCRK